MTNLQAAGLNVDLILIVHRISPVEIINAKILVQDLVEYMLFAELMPTLQFVAVLINTLEIHSSGASKVHKHKCTYSRKALIFIFTIKKILSLLQLQAITTKPSLTHVKNVDPMQFVLTLLVNAKPVILAFLLPVMSNVLHQMTVPEISCA